MAPLHSSSDPLYDNPQVLRTAALLGVTSLTLVYEGIGRCNKIIPTPSGKWFSDVRGFIPFLELLAWLIFLLMGLAGLLVSLAALIFGVGSKKATIACLVIQFCGWYSLIIELFFAPEEEYGDSRDGLTSSQSTLLDAMSIISGAAYCTAQQGTAVLFALQLYKLQKRSPPEATSKYNVRLVVYSLLVVVTGLCEIVFGATLTSELGRGKYQAVVIGGWLVSYRGSLNIVLGVVQALWGFWGLLKGLNWVRAKAGTRDVYFALGGCLVFLLELSLHNMAQVGIGTLAIKGLGVQLVGVTFCLAFAPVWMASAAEDIGTPLELEGPVPLEPNPQMTDRRKEPFQEV